MSQQTVSRRTAPDYEDDDPIWFFRGLIFAVAGGLTSWVVLAAIGYLIYLHIQ